MGCKSSEVYIYLILSTFLLLLYFSVIFLNLVRNHTIVSGDSRGKVQFWNGKNGTLLKVILNKTRLMKVATFLLYVMHFNCDFCSIFLMYDRAFTLIKQTFLPYAYHLMRNQCTLLVLIRKL